eukprot:gene3675-4230_t
MDTPVKQTKPPRQLTPYPNRTGHPIVRPTVAPIFPLPSPMTNHHHLGTPMTPACMPSTPSSHYGTPHGTPHHGTPYGTPMTTYRGQRPDTGSRSFFSLAIDSTPQPSSTSTEINVHSPPKESINLAELKLITEKETQLLRPEVTEWFRRNWYDANSMLTKTQILRTVYSVFCVLRKSARLEDDICTEFQSLWKSLVRVRPSHSRSLLVFGKSHQAIREGGDLDLAYFAALQKPKIFF